MIRTLGLLLALGYAEAFQNTGGLRRAGVRVAAFGRPAPLRVRSATAGRTKLTAVMDPTLVSHVLNGLADADVVDAVAAADPSWFDNFVNLIEYVIESCNGVLSSVTGQKSYGISIVLFTMLIKGLTYPLTYTQLESTAKMQAIQPQLKAIQAKYKSNPEVLNREMQMLYQDNQVNPLAGCLPALVQLPVFIGFYRALLKLANDNLLDEPFLWLPNLEGPVYGSQSSDWLFKNWVDGAPSLGWHDTLCFVSLPIILIISQSISQRLLTPPKPAEELDDAAAASQQIVQYLPIMIGFFALNVPSGLAVYWVTNNFVSTATTLLVKSNVAKEMEASGLSSASAATAPPPPPPPSASPASFSEMMAESSPVETVEFTAADAEIVSSESVLRDVEGFGAAGSGDANDPFSAPKPKKKKKKGGKKKRG